MLDAVVLLGWMKQESAIAFLRERCVFPQPLSREDASDLWRRHRRLIEQQAVRAGSGPSLLPLTPQEQAASAAFLDQQSDSGSLVRSVVKVDAAELRIRQLGVTFDRCDRFNRACLTRDQWMRQWLNPLPAPMQGKVRAVANTIDIELPHPEFVLGFDSVAGFRVVEAPRYLAVRQTGTSVTLMAGHHRTYAFLASSCGHEDRSVLAAVLEPGGVNDGGASTAVMEGAEDVCVRCPPAMADLLDERFALRVRMRPRRFELQIRARMATVAADQLSQ